MAQWYLPAIAKAIAFAGGERFPDGKRIRRRRIRVRGAVVERRPDMTKVLGSIPSAPTKYA